MTPISATREPALYSFAKSAWRRARANGYQSDVLTVHRLEARMRFLGWACVWCDGPFECIDHVEAVALGGLDMLDNLVPCCQQCNGDKGSLPISDWLDGEITRKPCGTQAGFLRHKREGSEPCNACRQAHYDYGKAAGQRTADRKYQRQLEALATWTIPDNRQES